MGKTPKKAAPGGDESNLYNRRLKATTSLPPKQRESENPNRGKAIGVPKRLPVPTAKVFKASTSKDEKKQSGSSTTSKDREATEMPTLHQESEEEAAVQLKVSITKKDVKDGERIAAGGEESESSAKEETVGVSQGHTNTNGKEAVIELTETENTTPPPPPPPPPRVDAEKEGNVPDKNSPDNHQQQTAEEKTTESRDNRNESSETIKNNSEDDESKTENRCSEFDDNALKLEDEEESSSPKCSVSNGDSQELARNEGHKEKPSAERQLKGTKVQTEGKKKPVETCSVDVVESTTSETSDSGHGTQTEKEQEANGNQEKDNPEIDASFVSYDASIMLKDVQIKLNDCLKDNSKLFDVSNGNEENGGGINGADEQKRLDMSFGKTLRNISGRSTINRLRYVTVREQRFSPNSSLFVNTSSASLDPEDIASCKLSRHQTDFSDTILTNGGPADRKRKIISETAASAKKLKTEKPERTSILNTSLEILKGIRRPIQVSTPNPKAYKFPTDKYTAKSFAAAAAAAAADTVTVDADVEPKKWCVIM